MTRSAAWRAVYRLGAMLLMLASLAGPAALAAAGPVMAAELAQADQDTAGVTVDQFHMIVAPEGDLIRVAEVYLLGNSSEEVFEGEAGVTVVFPLPEGAQQVTYEGVDGGGGPYRRVEEGIAETRSIAQGVAVVEARFAYVLPFAPGTRIAHPMPLPMESVVLLLTGTAWRLAPAETGAGLYTDLGVMEFGGEFARTYLISSLEAGDMLDFTVVEEDTPLSELLPSGQGGAASMGQSVPAAAMDSGMEVGLGIVAVAAAMALSYGLWRGSLFSTPAGAPRQADSGVQAGSPPGAVVADLGAIAELDARFADGQIDAATYRRLRQGLKARVRAALDKATLDDRDPGTD
jgi:hypothetical protein